MVVRENLIVGSKKFIRNYSDKGNYIERDNVKYEEAIDPIEFADKRIYTETDIPIESEESIDG